MKINIQLLLCYELDPIGMGSKLLQYHESDVTQFLPRKGDYLLVAGDHLEVIFVVFDYDKELGEINVYVKDDKTVLPLVKK